MAHKKGGGSSKVHPGQNVGKGSDDTLFARVSGRVDFDRSRGKSVVSVIEEPVLQEATA
jgi:large subunit ribosomal protein L27